MSALVVVAAAFARPLVEEWGFIDYWNEVGLGGYPHLAKTYLLRPLMPTPFALEWAIGGGSPFGFAMGFAGLIVAKYLAARWAVSPILGGSARWVVATLAAVLLAWPAEWQLRYSAAQLSTVFLMVGLGAALRMADRFSLRSLFTGTAAIMLMLASYQALVLCATTIPLVAMLGTSTHGADAESRFYRVRRMALSGAPVVLGFIAYAVYAYVARHVITAPRYEENLFNSGKALRSVSGIASAITDLYHTAYLDSALAFTVLLVVTVILVGPKLLAMSTGRERSRSTAVLSAGIVLLPLLSLPYVFSTAHRNDPDRVMFPVAVGFVLLAVTALARFDAVPVDLGQQWAVALVVPLLLSTAIDASTRYRDYHLEDHVLKATTKIANEHGATAVVLRDFSGTLGDVYLLYPPVFQQALLARRTPIDAVICTPIGVDRVHPIAHRLGVTSTPRCEESPTVSGALLLDARLTPDGAIAIALGVGDTPTAVTPGVGFSERESRGSQFWWWMTDRQGAVRVRGRPSSDVVLSMALASPPCGAVVVRLGGRLLNVAGQRRVDVPVTIGVSGSVTLTVSVPSQACTPKGSPRSLYVAIYNPKIIQK